MGKKKSLEDVNKAEPRASFRPVPTLNRLLKMVFKASLDFKCSLVLILHKFNGCLFFSLEIDNFSNFNN